MTKLYTKTSIMNFVAEGKLKETFDHSTQGKFAITDMRVFALKEKLKTETFNITKELYEHIFSSRVVEAQRVFELSFDSWKNDPILIVEYPPEKGETNSTHLIIDGTHRIVRRVVEKIYTFEAFVFTPAQIIRPDMTIMKDTRDYGLDWGDDMKDGKIIKRL